VGSGTTLEYCDLTDIGRRRTSNQDARAVLAPWSLDQYRRRGWLFVVADGMGAHAAGEMASALATEHVPLVYEKHASRSPPLALKESIEHANQEIHTRGESAIDLKGMGTTCTALALLPRGALVGHVGDSRAYRVRGGKIEQLSRDHSLAWEMEGHKIAGMEEPIPKNIITRSMGPHSQVPVDLEGPFPVEVGDVFVLCSDGLSGQVADEEIGAFAAALPPRDSAAALVGLSLVRGAPDNVTVIVAKAGAKEATKTSGSDAPWPLTLQPPATPAPRPMPWKLLSVAAGSLLVALILNPWSALVQPTGPIGGLLGDALAQALAFVVSVVMALLAVGAVTATILQTIAPLAPTGRVLPVGARLGGGPYRNYDCTPSQQILEGVVTSVESAADGLAPAERDHLLGAVAAARKRVQSRDFTGAVRVAAEAIAIYRRAVDKARSDDTTQG
jgi:PPM family protein phosphatase